MRLAIGDSGYEPGKESAKPVLQRHFLGAAWMTMITQSRANATFKMLWVRQTSAHSPRTLAKPRKTEWRYPRAGSTIILRPGAAAPSRAGGDIHPAPASGRDGGDRRSRGVAMLGARFYVTGLLMPVDGGFMAQRSPRCKTDRFVVERYRDRSLIFTGGSAIL